MKTTVDLPESLVLRAKRAALDRRLSLKTLVMNGLEREIASPSPAASHPLVGLRELDVSVWEGVNPDTYVAELRASWGE